jgi:hypothetical protein
MRLWSLHPSYLDRQGLLALWREGLLAQEVLKNKTKGYKNHPQLERFRQSEKPLLYLRKYLFFVVIEAKKRGYNFQIEKLGRSFNLKIKKIAVTSEQIDYEFNHLLKKLKLRDGNRYRALVKEKDRKLNPVFRKVQGKIASWEKIKK